MTSSQFEILMGAISELRTEVNGRLTSLEDKIDRRITPLEEERQQRIGAVGAKSAWAGVSRASVAVLAGIGSVIVALFIIADHLQF